LNFCAPKTKENHSQCQKEAHRNKTPLTTQKRQEQQALLSYQSQQDLHVPTTVHWNKREIPKENIAAAYLETSQLVYSGKTK
jgi:hypothetical protein